MQTVFDGSLAGDWKRARTTNSSDASFPSRVATTTTPADDGVVSLATGSGGQVPSWVKFVPFGAGSDNDTFDVRVIGWQKIGTLWVPTILLQFTATLSTAVGVAGTSVLDTERFADTVGDPASGMGAKGIDCQPTSPANNTPAHYTVYTRGCPKIEFLFDQTLNTPTMNVLYTVL